MTRIYRSHTGISRIDLTRIAIAAALALAMAGPLAAQDSPPNDKPADRPAAAKDDAGKAAAAPAAQSAPAMPPEMQAMMAAYEKAAALGPQHQQLARHFAGTWNTRQTMWMDPSTPPMTETGTDVSTAEFGGRHVRTQFTSQFMGQPFTGMAVTSYDNTRGKYVSSWIDSMSTGQFVAEGDYDADTRTYTFHGEMPDPMKPGGTTKVREVVRIIDDNKHVMEWYESHDGKERKSMEIEYTRAK